jgi:hypothetical protein
MASRKRTDNTVATKKTNRQYNGSCDHCIVCWFFLWPSYCLFFFLWPSYCLFFFLRPSYCLLFFLIRWPQKNNRQWDGLKKKDRQYDGQRKKNRQYDGH